MHADWPKTIWLVPYTSYKSFDFYCAYTEFPYGITVVLEFMRTVLQTSILRACDNLIQKH